ncbi:MAG: hypothetical protein IV093_16020 [Rubrivivax sp.]|nr:hypothetical protein [Rubrivivax sp.]
MKFPRTPASVCTLLLIAALVGCGGGGGGETTALTAPTPPTTPAPPTVARTVVSGTASAGVFSGADVRVYNAATYTGPTTSTAIASASTNASGGYEATLPDGFAGTLLIRALGRADGTSSVKDEVFGATTVTDIFVLESVVPASQVGPAGGRVTAHVTAYTHAMALYVARKLGQTDIDAAVVAARSHVAAKLTGGADPLSTLPTRADMVALLASASNIANATTPTVRNDPYSCSVKVGNADKIACTLKTVAAVLQPLAAAATATAVPEVNLGYATALSGAARTLDVARVAANTGVPAADLASAQTTAVAALDKTETEALVAAADKPDSPVALPLIVVKTTMGGRMTILEGPDAGVYQGWNYALSWCLDGPCPVDFDVRASITPQDVFEDPELYDDVTQAVGALLSEIVAIQKAVYARGRTAYPTPAQFAQIISDAVRQGLAAGSVATAASAARAGLAAAGFPVDATTAAPGTAPTATAEQVAAASACTAPGAYVNPSSPEGGDPQLDFNCRMGQVHACLHRAGFPEYDVQGRANCKIVNGLIDALTGPGNTFSCSYCSPSYPF